MGTGVAKYLLFLIGAITFLFWGVIAVLSPTSSVEISPQNWFVLGKTATGLAGVLLASATVHWRLEDDRSAIAARIRSAATGLRYMVFGVATFTALGLSAVILMYIVV